jgi:hypothetical protein
VFAAASNLFNTCPLPGVVQGQGTDLLGHNAAVLGVDWSQDGNYVLTSSADW